MNTTKIIFVRHAKAQYGEDDRTRPLTEEGLRNRAIVVETLKGRQIDSFLSSPLGFVPNGETRYHYQMIKYGKKEDS